MATDHWTGRGDFRQALGEFADWLENAGLASQQRDGADRRVRRLIRTELGDSAAEATSRAIATIEARWRNEIGPGRYDTAKEALRQLGHDSLKP